MKRYFRYYAYYLVILSSSSFAEPVTNDSHYWQCTTQDNTNRQWVARSIYKKIAINIAYSGCKKESQEPFSCKTSGEHCDHFINGVSVKPMWQCTALDQVSEAWHSNLYSQRDDAALAAKAYCKERSIEPDTCYINMVTCINRNEASH